MWPRRPARVCQGELKTASSLASPVPVFRSVTALRFAEHFYGPVGRRFPSIDATVTAVESTERKPRMANQKKAPQRQPTADRVRAQGALRTLSGRATIRPQIARTLGCARNTVYNVFGAQAFELGAQGGALGAPPERSKSASRSAAGWPPARASARSPAASRGRPRRSAARSGARRAARRYRAFERRAAGRRALRAPEADQALALPAARGERSRPASRGAGRPQQISARLKADHPEDPEMQISHETIYRSLYIQSRGELRRQLAANLRSARTRRRPRGGGPERRGQITDMVPISERPPEVADRAVPGHWEGDLLVGRQGRSFVATLVERQTRYVMLARLGSRAHDRSVIAALKQRIRELPRHLVLSLTWDQGNELAAHARFRERDRDRRLLLRSPLSLAAGLEREHQRAAAPIPAEGQRPGRSQPGRTRRDRR